MFGVFFLDTKNGYNFQSNIFFIAPLLLKKMVAVEQAELRGGTAAGKESLTEGRSWNVNIPDM